MKRLILVGALVMAASVSAHAQGWTGGLELGFTNTTGNSRDTTLTTRFDLKHENAVWNHELFGDAHYKRADGEKTAERYALGYKPRYYLDEKVYAFGILRYDRDRFADILHRWTEVIGYGRQFIDTPTTEFEAELGVGARQTVYDVNPDDLDRNEPVLYAGAKFTHEISDSAKFLQTLRVEHGDDNTYAESVTSLQMRITSTISSKLSHTVRHNSSVLGSRGKKTDQITAVTMVYSF